MISKPTYRQGAIGASARGNGGDMTKRIYGVLLAAGILVAAAVTLGAVTIGPSYADCVSCSSCTNSN